MSNTSNRQNIANKFRRPFTFDRVVRLVLSVVGIVLILWLIKTLKDVLLPFCVACLIAYMMEPFVQYNKQLLHLKKRIGAVFITLFEMIVLVGIAAYFLLPSVFDELHQVATMIRNYANSADVDIRFLPHSFHEILRRNIDLENLASHLTQQNVEMMMHRGGSLLSGGVGFLLGVLGWLIVFLYVIFIMLDYERLMTGFRLLVPPRLRPAAYKLGNDIKESMNHYFRGQALISCCAAVIYCVGFSIVGIPLAIVIGLMTGVFFMVPYLQYISIIPVTLLCMVYSMEQPNVEFWPVWWESMAVFATVQVVADLILTPKIMGKAMGLNPAIILLSLSVWGTLLGFVGMIIALPLTTLLLAYYEEYVIRGNRYETAEEQEAEIQVLENIKPVEKDKEIRNNEE